jgi:hypothetical protein
MIDRNEWKTKSQMHNGESKTIQIMIIVHHVTSRAESTKFQVA